ncbi:MAG: SBBP repeat-containing protein [Bryobacterales bacterium]|nr:SBBP repeat-containing protein [Bryobacterales bacterium]
MRFFRRLTLSLLAASAILAPLHAQRTSSVNWSTYVTGDKAGAVQAIAMDRDGAFWVAGSTAAQFESPGPNQAFQSAPKGGTDVFIAKYRRLSDGVINLEYWTWIGGAANEEVRGIALDSLGRVYVTGITTSTDFPQAGFYAQLTHAGEQDAFLTVIDSSFAGSDSVVHSSLYGGLNNENVTGVAVDSQFNVYVVGYSTSKELPSVSTGAQTINRGGWDSFLYKVDPSNSSPLRYATFFGGKSTDIATGIAVDSRGVVWFTGHTSSDDFPASGTPYRDFLASFFDGFLVAIDTRIPGLNGIQYGSYLGGNGADHPRAMGIGPDGKIWIAGYTFSADLPVTDTAVQRTYSGNADLFLMAIDPTVTGQGQIVYSTYFGDGDTDIPNGISILRDGRIAIAGYTASNNFPLAGGALQISRGGSSIDGFVAIVNPASATPEYSSYLGGISTDIATGIAVDADNGIYVTGYTNSRDFPREENGPTLPGGIVNTGFVLRISR